MSRGVRVRGYGPVRPDIAEAVSTLVQAHDAVSDQATRRDIRGRISNMMNLPAGDALNVARKVDRVVRLAEH